MTGSVLDGIQAEITRSGGDVGASTEAPVEQIPEVVAEAAVEEIATPQT